MCLSSFVRSFFFFPSFLLSFKRCAPWSSRFMKRNGRLDKNKLAETPSRDLYYLSEMIICKATSCSFLNHIIKCWNQCSLYKKGTPKMSNNSDQGWPPSVNRLSTEAESQEAGPTWQQECTMHRKFFASHVLQNINLSYLLIQIIS